MAEGTHDQLQVAFPASEQFLRVGRVTVVGLALRLGIDVTTVERLRAAVDAAVSALLGPGRISIHASWTETELEIALSNPEALVDDQAGLTERLTELIGLVKVESDRVTLTLETGSA